MISTHKKVHVQRIPIKSFELNLTVNKLDNEPKVLGIVPTKNYQKQTIIIYITNKDTNYTK